MCKITFGPLLETSGCVQRYVMLVEDVSPEAEADLFKEVDKWEAFVSFGFWGAKAVLGAFCNDLFQLRDFSILYFYSSW